MNRTTSSSALTTQDAQPRSTALRDEAIVLTCPSCERSFEASADRWCHCIGTDPAPVCTACNGCSCNASHAKRQAFWLAAPELLRQQRREIGAARRADAAASSESDTIIDVLIVDDDEEIRLMAAYMVQSMGYRVETAASASDALYRMQHCRPAVVLTDAFMPHVDGRTLCRMIKVDVPEVHVIVMSSLYTAPRYKYEAYKTFRADEYLVKPIDFNRLHEVLVRFVPTREVSR